MVKEWEQQRFSSVFDTFSNNTYTRDELADEGGTVRNIHYGDILVKYGSIVDCNKETIPYIKEGIHKPGKQKIIRDGDLIIADTAEDNTVCKAVEVQNVSGEVLAGLHTIHCRPIDDRFVPGWLGYYINSSTWHDQIIPFITGIKVSSVSKTNIKKTSIHIPPKPEQERIVNILSDMDSLLFSLEKEIAKKSDIRYGLMQSLLSGKDRLSGFYKEWKDTTLGKICEIKDGTHQTPRYVSMGVPFYSVETVTNDDYENVKYITGEEHRELTAKYRIENGDVLMTRIGSLGKCKYIDWDVDASFYVSLALLKFKGNKDLAKFVSYLSELEFFYKEVELHSLQFAIPMKINLGQIGHVRIRIPSDNNEIVAINTVFDDLTTEIKGLKKKYEKYYMLRQGMMQELLSGRIRLI